LQYRLAVLLLEDNQRKESLAFFEKALQIDYSKNKEVFEYAPVLLNDKELLHLISSFKK